MEIYITGSNMPYISEKDYSITLDYVVTDNEFNDKSLLETFEDMVNFLEKRGEIIVHKNTDNYYAVNEEGSIFYTPSKTVVKENVITRVKCGLYQHLKSAYFIHYAACIDEKGNVIDPLGIADNISANNINLTQRGMNFYSIDPEIFTTIFYKFIKNKLVCSSSTENTIIKNNLPKLDMRKLFEIVGDNINELEELYRIYPGIKRRLKSLKIVKTLVYEGE